MKEECPHNRLVFYLFDKIQVKNSFHLIFQKVGNSLEYFLNRLTMLEEDKQYSDALNYIFALLYINVKSGIAQKVTVC